LGWLDLRTGYTCNQRCRFCDQGDRRDTHGDAATSAVIARLEARRSGEEGVWLAGGEVTLRRDLPELIRAARRTGFTRVGIQSNGRVLAARGAAAGLRELGLTDVAVAVHAHVAVIHDWLTREPGSFAQASAGARNVTAAGLGLVVHTVLSRSLGESIAAMAAWVARVGARGHRWYHPRSLAAGINPLGPPEADLVPRYSLVEASLRASLDWERERGIEAETVGFPLCVLGPLRACAADRPDAGVVRRDFPTGFAELPAARTYGPPCRGCAGRPGCGGVDPAYPRRWGWGELTPLGGSAPVEHGRLLLTVEPADTRRSLRQRLVAAAGDLDRIVVFGGQDPWAHPVLPTLVRDAVKLGFREVGVVGSTTAMDGLDADGWERIEGLSWAETGAAVAEAVAARLGGRLRLVQAGVADPDAPPTDNSAASRSIP
jgi:MoaA/NifB/PqqE/SkfB family radical SAM enzyme